MNQKDRPVKYFRVSPEAYRQVVGVLRQLPYGQVAGVMANLESGTRAVFDEPAQPQQPGKIVDKPAQSVDPEKAADSNVLESDNLET